MKRLIYFGDDTYTFENVSDGMLMTKNSIEIGVYPNFTYGDNLEDAYLIELALEFEDE